MPVQQRTVLITGCTDGTAGASLAREFHRRGLRVFATARRLESMQVLAAMGIETLELDVTDQAQIAAAVESVRKATTTTTTIATKTKDVVDGLAGDGGSGGGGDGGGLGKLDILVNNAASWNLMTAADQDLNEARKMFEINFFGVLAVTQAFLPLLLAGNTNSLGKEKDSSIRQTSMVVNVGSISSLAPPVFQGVYAGTKAAVAALSDVMRMELALLGVHVVLLMTGSLATRFLEVSPWRVPGDSMYGKVSGLIEQREHMDMSRAMAPDEYARRVVGDLLRKKKKKKNQGAPPRVVYRGSFISIVWTAVRFGLTGFIEAMYVKQAKLDTIEKPGA